MKFTKNNMFLIAILFIPLLFLTFQQHSDSFTNNEYKKCSGPFIGANYNHFSNKNGCGCQNKENFTSCHNEHKDKVNHFSSCHNEHKNNLENFTSCHNEHKDKVNHFSSCQNEHKDKVNHFSSCQKGKYLDNKEQFISENINRNRNVKNPCVDYLSDTEFLVHMIPHHQVAIDMSLDLMKVTKSPIMKNICRKIIWQQRYEITMMNAIMNKLPLPGSERKKIFSLGKSKLAYHEPKNSTSDGECNPLFFKPDDHKKHMEHMDLTDKSYLDHMVPHHQVAVDMCKRLLLHTSSTHMMALCYDLIYGQQAEILQMNQLKDNIEDWKYNTNFLD